jgi:hypothetical protein
MMGSENVFYLGDADRFAFLTTGFLRLMVLGKSAYTALIASLTASRVKEVFLSIVNTSKVFIIFILCTTNIQKGIFINKIWASPFSDPLLHLSK